MLAQTRRSPHEFTAVESNSVRFSRRNGLNARPKCLCLGSFFLDSHSCSSAVEHPLASHLLPMKSLPQPVTPSGDWRVNSRRDRSGKETALDFAQGGLAKKAQAISKTMTATSEGCRSHHCKILWRSKLELHAKRPLESVRRQRSPVIDRVYAVRHNVCFQRPRLCSRLLASPRRSSVALSGLRFLVSSTALIRPLPK